MSDNINNPLPVRIKAISLTRASDAASGDVSYTGVGFKAKMAIFIVDVDATTVGGIGVDDGTTPFSMQQFNTLWYNSSTYSIQADLTGAATGQFAIVKTFDQDGFTLTWTKLGAPAGGSTIKVTALCIG